MISKISITALVATCLMVGSNASPCRVSSRTTQIPTSLTTKATSAVTGTATETTSGATGATENTISSTTALLSNQELTITVTESSSGTQTTSTLEESITTTDESTATVEPTTTEAATTSDEPITTAEPTTTTAAASTTTAEAPAGPTFITNGGFEDSSESVSPWRLVTSTTTTVAIDTNVRHDGQNSARINFAMGDTYYLQQSLQSISEGVSYTVSAWIRPDPGCITAYVFCSFAYSFTTYREVVALTPADGNIWRKVSTTCSYTQDQLDEGNLYVNVGYYCPSGSTSYIDSVAFT